MSEERQTDTAPGAWQSDVIADLIKQYGFPFIALNPGASYRGLHDSLVNHNNNDPPMLVCQHEKIAVQIAHGYAKVTGQPLAVIVHNVVGLLHAVMGIYYAYTDRCPVFVIGATGPLDEGKRRPRVDWIHTANVQGEQVRNYVKWDYQPGGIEGVPDSFARAYSIMMTEPRGPIYMCYDAWLQEAPLAAPVALPSSRSAAVPSRLAPDPAALEAAAERVLQADWPVLLPEYVGRVETGFGDMVALAETLGAPVVDVGTRLNFPTTHPLDLRMNPDAFRRADLIVGLDLRDWERLTHHNDRINRTKRALALGARIEKRREAVSAMHQARRAKWREEAKAGWDSSPISLARLASEAWAQIKDEDWVLTTNAFEQWALKLWDFDRHYRHPGRALGTGTQIGMALGVALAHRGKGRLVVDCQTDGDLMFDAGALWTAAKHDIPILVVMHNNRAYYNDWEHQITVARQRGTPPERAYIGMDISGPDPDFATLARSMGWHAEGPVDQPGDIAGALARAIVEVKRGRPALIDTITQFTG